MSWEFGDVDLKAHLHMQAEWNQTFVDAHFQQRHGWRGQRKLFLSNLLTVKLAAEDMQRNNDTRKIKLVVAGASPGVHLPVLVRHLKASNIGDRIDMHLYDPKPLHRAVAGLVRRSADMTFTQDEFRDSHALQWSRRDAAKTCLIFLSDIRSDIHGKAAHSCADEAKIGADMHKQKQWVETMRPDYSMLKFHARHATRDDPSVAPSFRYLAGDLYKQADTDLFSAECRLFVTQADIKEKEYSTADIERHMFFHNQSLRPRLYAVQGGAKHLQFDEAFQFHVAQEAGRVLGLDADAMLKEACAKLPVDPIAFTWTAPKSTRMQTLLRGVQACL
jgi:Poly A polymerase regulatory subunit